MESMKEIVKSYFEKANEGEKKSIEEKFRKYDVDDDGKISVQELKNSIPSNLGVESLFKKLDTNGDGTLDFDEFLFLHYMLEKKMTFICCDGCKDLLVGPYFSCSLCIERFPNTYDLCCSCYRLADFAHHHSPDYMLDHYSISSLLKDRNAAAQKSHNKKAMEELHQIAKAHYEVGSPQVKELADKFYKSMDTDGDGRVDLSEFLAFMRQEGCSYMQNPYFFKELDVDGNGTLDFSEVMTLYYIIKSGRPFCDSCGTFIPGIFFSCVECFEKAETSFDLCGDCYRSSRCTHNHGGRAEFLDNYTFMQAVRTAALTRAAPPPESSNPGNQARKVPHNTKRSQAFKVFELGGNVANIANNASSIANNITSLASNAATSCKIM